jgi:hypothetical protein
MVWVSAQLICNNLKGDGTGCTGSCRATVGSADGRNGTTVASFSCDHWERVYVTATTTLGFFFGANAQADMHMYATCKRCKGQAQGSVRCWGWANGDTGNFTLACQQCNHQVICAWGEHGDWKNVLADAVQIWQAVHPAMEMQQERLNH